MIHACIAPFLDADVHLVLCRFGRAGLAYVETDPAEADALGLATEGGGTPESTAQTIRREQEQWRALGKELGVEPQ